MSEPVITPESKPARQAWKDLFRLAVIAAFFVAAGVVLNHGSVRAHLFDFEYLRSDLQSRGFAGILWFVVAGAFINALGVPRLWISAAAGSLFGAVEGMGLGLVTTLIGASISFLMGRSLLRGPIKRRMPEGLRRWYTAFNKHGFRAILYMRLFPGANATLTSLLGGVSRMRYRDFLLATFIGFIPFTVIFATLGSSAAKQNEWQLVAGLVLFGVVALAQLLYSRRSRVVVVSEDDLPERDVPGVKRKALE